MFKNRRKIAICLLVVFVMTLTPIVNATINTEAEFLQFLADSGIPLNSTNGKNASWNTFQRYNLIVYGEPTNVPDNDLAWSDMTDRDEYRYLGYTASGELYTNSFFRNDDRGSKSPTEWNYISVEGASSWLNVEDGSLYDYMMSAPLSFEGVEYPSLTVNSLTKDKAKLLSPATLLNGFSVFTRHKSNKIWYATLIGKPMGGGSTNVGCDIKTTDGKTTYTIKSGEHSVTVPVTVTADATLGGAAKAHHIKELKAEFNGLSSSLSNVTQTIHNGSITYFRKDFNGEGTYPKKLMGNAYMVSVFNDYFVPASDSMDINIVVEPETVNASVVIDKVDARVYIPDTNEYLETAKFIENNDVQVRLDIIAHLEGYSKTENIKGWAIYAKPNDDAANINLKRQPTIESNFMSAGSINTNHTFWFTIPKDKLSTFLSSAASFEQAYKATAYVYFDQPVVTIDKVSREWISASGYDSINVTKNQPNGPIKYRYYKNSKNDSNLIGSETSTILAYTHTVKIPSSFKGTDSITYTKFLNANYSGTAVKAGSSCVNGTKISISNTKGELYVDVIYETPSNPIPVPTPTPTPIPAPINEPPVAIIDSPLYVEAGNEVRISGTGSYDKDGSIVNYSWYTPGTQNTLSGSSGTTWYADDGKYEIYLDVIDNLGAPDNALSTINILPPIPSAILKTLGALKENRKVTLDATSSRSQTHYPIIWNSTTLSLNAVSGGTNGDIKYNGFTNGVSSKDVLFKKPGDYTAELSVWNGKRWGTALITLPIAEDKAPIADFSVASKIVRNELGVATIQILDTSYSEDGDNIGTRLFTLEYDTNNNGVFDDGSIIINTDSYMDGVTQLVIAPWGDILEVTVNKPSGKPFTIDIKSRNVGKYKIEMSVTETFGQNTIPEFITAADYKSDNTLFDKPNTEKTFEIINIAPSTDFSMIERKSIDVVVMTDYTGSKLADLQSKLNTFKAEQLGNNLDINFILFNNQTKIGTQNSTVVMENYARYIRHPYYKTGYKQIYSSGYREDYNNTYVANDIPYETCTIMQGDVLPALSKPNTFQWQKTITNGSYQGMGFGYIYDEYVYYDPQNYSGSVVTRQLMTTITTMSSYEYWTYYMSGQPTLNNHWSYVNNYNQNVTSDIYAFDYSKLNNITYRDSADRYMLVVSDSTNTISYNKSFGGYYPFANLNKSNLLNYVQANNVNVYAVVPDSVKELNMGQTAYGITYADTKGKQDITLRDLINYTNTDGKLYSMGQVDKALTDISAGNIKPENNKIDLVVATDYTGSKLTDLKAKLSNTVANLTANNYDISYQVFDNTNAIAIGTGYKTDAEIFATSEYTIIKKSDNTYHAAGSNYYKQIDNTARQYIVEDWYGGYWAWENGYIATPKQIQITNVKKIEGNGYALAYLKNDGALWVSGTSNDNSLGMTGINGPYPTPTQNTNVTNVEDVELTSNTMIIKKNNKLYAVGRNQENVWGIGTNTTYYTSFTQIYSGTNITSYSLSRNNTLLIADDGYVKGAGYNSSGQIGNYSYNNEVYLQYAYQSSGGYLNNVVKVACGATFSMALKNDGTVWVAGDNSYMMLGANREESRLYYFYPVANLADVVDIYAGATHLIAKKKDGTYWIWGYFNFGVVTTPRKIDIENIKQVSVGDNHMIVLTNSGDIYGLGYNSSGQLCTGNTNHKYSFSLLPVSDKTSTNIYGPDVAAIQNYPVRDGSKRYFIAAFDGTGSDLAKPYGGYYGFGNLTNTFGENLKTKNFEVFGIYPDAIKDYKLTAPAISSTVQDITLNALLGKSPLGGGYYPSAVKVLDIIQSRYNEPYINTSNTELLVVAGEPIEYRKFYSDIENDIKYTDKWVIEHDETYYEMNTGKAPFHGLTLNEAITIFSNPGLYTIRYSARDNPKNDELFDNYRLWSKEADMTIKVHRKPISEINYELVPAIGNYYTINLTSNSYDLDHISQLGKGIVDEVWKWKEYNSDTWTLGKLSGSLPVDKSYVISLESKDMEGAWSEPDIVTISTTGVSVDCTPLSRDSSPLPITATVTAALKGSSTFRETKYCWSTGTIKPVTGWQTSNSLTFTTTQSTEATWYLHMESFDNQGNSFYRYRGPYIIQTNRPPTVSIASVAPSAIYEGDNISVTVNVGDQDLDPLQLTVTLYDSSNNQVRRVTRSITPSNGSYNTQNIALHSDINSGNFRIVASISDGKASATDTRNISVGKLDITAIINPNPCLAGERIQITANTTGKGQYVVVDLDEVADGKTLDLTADNPTTNINNIFRGNYIVPLQTDDGTYEVIFTVYKSTDNGWRTDTTIVQLVVEGNVYNLIRPRIIQSN